MALSLPILTFHDITNRPSVISIPSEVFRKGIDKLPLLFPFRAKCFGKGLTNYIRADTEHSV